MAKYLRVYSNYESDIVRKNFEKIVHVALLVETSRAYAIGGPKSLSESVCPSVTSVCPSGRLSVCKQFLLPHLL